MIEKVNPQYPQHPDKVAKRIAGALVDYAYTKQHVPSVAVEVLIGHGKVTIIAETSVPIPNNVIKNIVKRIAGNQKVECIEAPQNPELARNQGGKTRAGGNGIFKGVPIDSEMNTLSDTALSIYAKHLTGGKYIYDKADNRLILCQSNATDAQLEHHIGKGYGLTLNIRAIGIEHIKKLDGYEKFAEWLSVSNGGRAMTGNTKGLDEILNAVTNFTYDAMAHRGDPLVGTLPTMDKATAKQALLDWHNKQIEAELEALREEVKHEDLRTISQIITARIDKLKESK